jgi:SecD/SecF fusion protein
MKNELKIKIGLILFVIGLCLWALWPSFERYVVLGSKEYEALQSTDRDRYQRLTEGAIHLGLDLQGGMYLLMRVRAEEVLDKELEGLVNDVRDWLGRDQIPFLDVRKVERRLEVAFQQSEQLERGRTRLQGILGNGFALSSRTEAARQVLLVEAQPSYVNRAEEDAFAQVMETLRNRIDELGVAEPTIQRQGMTGHRILIQLPGLKDPEQAKRVIGKVAQLQFRIVRNSAGTKEELTARYPMGCPDTEPEDGKEIYTCPDGSIVLPGSIPAFADQERPGYYHLEGNVPASGRDLEGANVSTDQYGKPSVAFTIKPASSDAFGRLTRENLGKQMAIILDDQVRSAPTLQGRITRNGEITGYFTAKEAYELALTLRSGALPASVEILEERRVGASLGEDSIRKGFRAFLIGAAAVLLFMMYYYKRSGINAVITLFVIMLIILATLAGFGATLSLPGIAALVLTLGMAVDANVIIFERMREELRLGKSVRASIAAGFEKALSAIADSNITTFIAALVLLQFGSGPVRGFGVTLAIGICATLFGALVVSRTLFDLRLARGQDLKLRFGTLVQNTHIDFFRIRRPAMLASAALILAGFVFMGINRAAIGNAMNWGIDFSGGALLQAKFNKPVSIGDVRSVLEKAGFEPTIQQFGDDNEMLIRTFTAEDIVSQKRREVQQKIQDTVQLPFQFDTQATHAELVLVAEPGTDAAELKAAVDGVGLGDEATVTLDEDRVRVRLSEVTARILHTLQQQFGPQGYEVEERRTELVGPQVGAELKEAAIWALSIAVLCTLIYLSIRFEFPYALGAVIASAHDAMVMIAFFAIFRLEVDLTVVAALLTIIGYSLNDTIVIFDRVRENAGKFRKEGFIPLINESLNETLGRTILTSLTTFLTVFALLVLGGDVIRSFATAMLIGVVAGTYSTIYIASPVVYYWNEWQEKRSRAHRAGRAAGSGSSGGATAGSALRVTTAEAPPVPKATPPRTVRPESDVAAEGGEDAPRAQPPGKGKKKGGKRRR